MKPVSNFLEAGHFRKVIRAALSCAVWVWIGLLCSALRVEAHGVSLVVREGPARWVQGRYSDDEPMSYVKVNVLNPQGKTHQVGNADSQGRFAWLADEAGTWRLVFDDGMGHHVELAVDVSAPSSATPSAGAPREAAKPAETLKPSTDKALLGLSILFFLFGLLFWWNGKKNQKSNASTQK